MVSVCRNRRSFVSCSIAVGAFALSQSGCSNGQKSSYGNLQRDSLHFSNTMQWDARLKSIAESVKDQPRLIELPSAPSNSSSQMECELVLMKKYQANLRTDSKTAEINQEAELARTMFNSISYTQHARTNAIASLLKPVLDYIEFQIMRNKLIHDRVRPSVLDQTITTILPVPKHPSYPSGHATQAHLIALVLGDVEPSHRTVYQVDAQRIAKNREIAGLHYPSDSIAGEFLAYCAYQELQSTDTYKKLLAACTKQDQ